jgi:DNA-binding transcriptional ArsR family regulator
MGPSSLTGPRAGPPPPDLDARPGPAPARKQLTRLCFTCKFFLTGERTGAQGVTLTSDELLTVLTAVANPHRMRIVAELRDGRVHVSELARRLGMSRPLLYMHLDKLEKAGLVAGQLELSVDGKAMKYFELAPFDLHITAETIIMALREDDAVGGDNMKESSP